MLFSFFKALLVAFSLYFYDALITVKKLAKKLLYWAYCYNDHIYSDILAKFEENSRGKQSYKAILFRQ
jgi:hypothetical protein